MPSFKAIHERALQRKGGPDGLKQWMPATKSLAKLAATPDHRFLAEMTRCIFQAGFVWKVIDQKWPDFEKVFFGFAPEKLVMLSPDQWDTIAADRRIVRNLQKISSVPKNAQFILEVAAEQGSFAQWVARWPGNNLIALLEAMKSQGNRLGGVTGMRVLRNLGKDCFLLSSDVIVCLKAAGLDIDKATSKRELKLIQATFNAWHDQTGLPYSHLSRICSCSVGENYDASGY